jgi:hypothetical protein
MKVGISEGKILHRNVQLGFLRSRSIHRILAYVSPLRSGKQRLLRGSGRVVDKRVLLRKAPASLSSVLILFLDLHHLADQQVAKPDNQERTIA